MHRVTHRGRCGSAQPTEFGRLPSNGFGANVNRPRDTAARKTGETRQSSGPARLSDPGDRTSSEARHEGQDQGSRTTTAHADDVHGEPDRDRWTTQGLAPRGTPETRSATGYSRPSPGLASRMLKPGSETSMAKSNPDLARGRSKPVRRGASSPRSIMVRGYRSRRGRSLLEPRGGFLPPLLGRVVPQGPGGEGQGDAPAPPLPFHRAPP